MSAQPKLNIASIIGIKDGIYQVFSLMDQNLEVYSKHLDNDNLIKDCRNYIHQLDGLLEMLNLTSTTVVTEKMEQLVDALIFKKIEPNPAIFDALKQSTKALLFYLNELIDGAEENPLRLFPAYRELMQVYGYQNAPESDLFFPKLAGNPALKAEAAHIDAATAKLSVKKLAADFQAGLLKWLRDPSNQSGLQQMTAAVAAIEEFPGTAEQRSFWWVTGGFLESLMSLEAGQIDLPVRRLCGKIEQTIRHLAADTRSETSVLLRELLYHISQSESTGQRTNDIKQCYTWPGQNASDHARTFEESEALNPILERLRDTLMQTNDIWREFCAGHENSLPPLLEYIDWLGHQAEQTNCAPLIKLIDAIGNTVAYLHAQPQDMNEELAMEMATALLLIETIIDDFDKLSPDLPHQVDILTSRLIGITAGDVTTNELPSAPTFNAIASKTQEIDIQTHVAQEILANLNQIESILDKFFFEPSKRSELSLLPEFFKQISGALIMLNLERANILLNHCQNLINKLLDPEYQIIEAEQILLVDGLSSLSFFIEASKSGQPDSYHIIEEALALFRLKPASINSPLPPENIATVPVIAAETAIATVQQQDVQRDSELLAIFLEEADEVLVNIAHDLQKCHVNVTDHDTLRDLRRGFHTLKGSGRMVGLEEMSEIAWKVEQVLNDWLQAKKLASQPLIDFINHAHQAYSDWCHDLRQRGTAEVDADALLLEAQALLAELTATQPSLTETETQAPAVRTAAVEDRVQDKIEVSSAEPPAAPELVIPETPVTESFESINPELIQVFLEETHESIPLIGGKLRAWRMLPQDEDIHRAMLRLLHTLKGSARMAGALHLGELIHAMESHVESAFREHNISDVVLDQLENEFDAISDRIEQLQNRGMDTIATNQQVAPVIISESVPSPIDKIESLQSKTIVRINSELIDRLVNDSGEASILRSKVEAQLSSFKQSLQDLAESTHRLHDQLREVEIQAETQMQTHLAQQQDNEPSFDPLEFDRFTRFQELTRMMAESVDDIIAAQKSLRTTHTIAEEAVAQQASVNHQLQQSLLQIRTIPFNNYAERYYRIARQVADDMDKKAQLDIQGMDVEIDRNILEKINPPLEHMLRNAIAHGIEAPAERIKAGKPEAGQVSIQLRQESNEVIITVSDDGRGLDLSRIRAEAQRLGLVQENEALDEDKIIALIFKQGLSTTDTVNDIAGRGIGLDVVKNEISLLGGRISVNSVPGQGTTFTIHLPLTLSVTQTFMVRAGKQNYAIPAFIVEHHREFDPEILRRIYQHHAIELNEKKYRFAHLSHLLGEPSAPPALDQSGQILFLHSGTQHLAIQVDELTGNSEIIAKNIGDQLAQAPGVEGATITADGEVILVLNPVKLLQRNDVQQVFNTPVAELLNASHKKPVKTPTVLVVDDSLTVRKVTCRLLEREGCDVLIAKNGAEAVSILQENTPDVMLVDLEMPKMNGFELIKNVRGNPKTAAIPVVIISSRTAEKHQKIAKDLGVNVFLGKPYKEEELLNHLSEFVSH
ncbi:Hpt domain-containing protein [Nitrosomonas sp.]|uniref:hybrid sensor histidine kinase/response regulator n=1 Tax=Nitrosomonas sp. TaxID=42353 RepID=UPI001D99DAF1|nr:Hpt domain-containing protein [Nitrosomonas sp.]MBX3617704.1 Hpt domain-containing protein [Nitrosomonas sp.]